MVLATSQQEFSDADFAFVDNADQSKKLKFQVSGIATGTTRTWTVPDSDVTVSPFAAALLDDTTAGAVLTTLGVSSFVQGALDETTRGGFLDAIDVMYNLGTIADDAAVSVTLGTQTEGATCILQLNTNISIIFSSRTAATATGCLLVAKTTTSYTVTMNNFSSFYAGTTGTDGQMSIGAHTSGVLSIENRTGASIAAQLFVLKNA